MKWYGGFGQLEYADDKFSLFLNISEATSMYKRIDYFKKKDLVLADTTFNEALGTSVSTEIIYDENGNIVGANKVMIEDTIFHNGLVYTQTPQKLNMLKVNGKSFTDGPLKQVLITTSTTITMFL